MKNTLCKLTFLLLAVSTLSGCSAARFAPHEPDPMPSFSVPDRIRVALVLGSGGARGMAHVGVLEELENAGIPIDLIVGCSSGSIVGSLYAYNPCIEEIKTAVSKVRAESLFDVDILHCKWGLSQGKALNRILHNFLGSETFDDLQIPLVIVAADLNSGELVPIGAGPIVEAVQASCSLPFIFVPREHMGRILIDGGTINPVPVKVARDLGAEIIIAVDLCELLDKTFPTNLFGVVTRSAEIAFMWQNETCNRDADVKIFPKTCGVGTFSDEFKQQLYEAGRSATREQLPKIRELLAKINMDPPCKTRTVCLECYAPGINMEKDLAFYQELDEAELQNVNLDCFHDNTLIEYPSEPAEPAQEEKESNKEGKESDGLTDAAMLNVPGRVMKNVEEQL